MTTIAFDGKSLCTDSQVSSGDIRFGVAQKIHKVDGGYVALAGDCALIGEVVKWMNGGEKPERKEGEDFTIGLYVTDDGEAFEISPAFRVWPACIPWAGGSGEVIALSVMAHSGTAREAVEIACQLDKGSSLPIQEVQIMACKKKGGGKKK